MISFISIILRHYVFCFLGASVRYLWDLIVLKVTKGKRTIKFKDYRNYDEHQDVEMIDAIVGFIIFGLIIAFFVRLARINGW